MDISRSTVEMAYYTELMGLLEKKQIAEEYADILSDDIFSHINKYDPEYRKAADAAIRGENLQMVALGIFLLYESLSEHPKMLKEKYRDWAQERHTAYDHLLYERFHDFMQEMYGKPHYFTIVDFEALMKNANKNKEEKYDA